MGGVADCAKAELRQAIPETTKIRIVAQDSERAFAAVDILAMIAKQDSIPTNNSGNLIDLRPVRPRIVVGVVSSNAYGPIAIVTQHRLGFVCKK
jgi:hypothetical protein